VCSWPPQLRSNFQEKMQPRHALFRTGTCCLFFLARNMAVEKLSCATLFFLEQAQALRRFANKLISSAYVAGRTDEHHIQDWICHGFFCLLLPFSPLCCLAHNKPQDCSFGYRHCHRCSWHCCYQIQRCMNDDIAGFAVGAAAVSLDAFAKEFCFVGKLLPWLATAHRLPSLLFVDDICGACFHVKWFVDLLSFAIFSF